MLRTTQTTLSQAIRLWVLAWLCMASPAYAADAGAIHDLAALADPAGTQSIRSVSQPQLAAQFKPAPHGFSAGFTRTVHWLRFTLQAPPANAKGERALLLEIHPPYLDDLQLYLSQPQAPGTFEVRRAGDLLPHAAKEYPYRAFVFRVDFADAQPRTVYVRLRTSSSSLLVLRAWEPGHFVAQASREYAVLGVLLGIFLAALLANLWQGLWLREALYRRYISYLLATLFNAISVNGLAGEFLLPHSAFWAHHWVPLGVLLAIICGTRFYMLALDIDHAPVWMRWFYRVQLWVAVACLPTSFLDWYPEAAKVALPLALLTLMTGALRSVQLWRQQNSNGKILLLAHVLTLAGSVSAIPMLLGVLPGQFWLMYGYQVGPIGTLLVLQLMLAKRVHGMQTQLHQATLEAELAQAAAVQERSEREHQRHFLSMLTHELKTPLSIIRMRLGAKEPTLRMQTYAKQAVADIDAIVERCAMVSQMEDKAEPLKLVPCRIDELLTELVAQQSVAHRLAWQITEGAKAAPLHSEPLLLRTILGNLIDNAIRYSPPGSAVRLEVALAQQGQRQGVQVHICNAEGAAGTPDPAHIFEKYYRAPGAHQQSGSGLGLYIVKALAQQLGASIACRPQAGLIVFALWLPL